MTENTPDARPLRSKRREKWYTFLAFVGFSALEIWVLLTKGLALEHWRDWIILGGAVLFPVCAILSWRSLKNDWTQNEEDKRLTRAVGWLIAVPVSVVAIGVVIWSITSTLGWLGSIPSWAAVIIVLLFFILLKRQ